MPGLYGTLARFSAAVTSLSKCDPLYFTREVRGNLFRITTRFVEGSGRPAGRFRLEILGSAFFFMEEAGSDAAAAAAERQALRDAAKAGDAARVWRLLDHGIGAPGIDAPDTHGWTALHHAAQSGSAPAMRALLAHGASHGSRRADA